MIFKMMKMFGSGDSPGSPKPIRIVVVGEKGTGKTSLIMSAVDESFNYENIPPVLPYTHFPAEWFTERIPATVIDTSSRPEDREKVIKEVKEADAIVLTFAFDRKETLDRLTEYWLPLFRQLQVRVPILMAGFRVTKKEDNQIGIEDMTPRKQQFQDVETFIDWSAHHGYWLARVVFGHAQQAATYPVGPIYDQQTDSLKPRCVAALTRIFILSTNNNNFILSDAELNYIQVRSYDQPLTPAQSRSLIENVRVRCPDGVRENGLTIDGFLFLNAFLVEEGRIRTVWTILRKFGYNKDLRLADDMLPYSSIKREPDQSVELTDKAIGFLRNAYQSFDEEDDNNVEPQMIGYLFQAAPENPWSEAPYKDAAEKTNNGGLSLEAFLSLWSLMTLINPARSLEYFICISYPEDASSAVRVTRRRELERKEQKSERNVVQCFVFGPKNSGKSAILNRFTGRPYDDDNIHGSAEERYAVNMVGISGVTGNAKKTLVMKEIQYREDGFLPSNEALAACDVGIFVYDSSDESSWKRVIDLLAEVATTSEDAGFEFPCLMVAAKTDLDPFPMAVQESTRVTQDIGIEAPIPISSKLGDFGNLFQKILTAAEHPHLCIPEIESRKKRTRKLINKSLVAVSIGTGAFVVGLASFRLYAARKQN